MSFRVASNDVSALIVGLPLTPFPLLIDTPVPAVIVRVVQVSVAVRVAMPVPLNPSTPERSFASENVRVPVVVIGEPEIVNPAAGAVAATLATSAVLLIVSLENDNPLPNTALDMSPSASAPTNTVGLSVVRSEIRAYPLTVNVRVIVDVPIPTFPSAAIRILSDGDEAPSAVLKISIPSLSLSENPVPVLASIAAMSRYDALP